MNPTGAFSKPVSLPASNPWFNTASPSLATLHHNFMKMDLLSNLRSCGALMQSPFSQSFPLVPNLSHPLGPMFQTQSYRQNVEENKAQTGNYNKSFAIRSLLGEKGIENSIKKVNIVLRLFQNTISKFVSFLFFCKILNLTEYGI